MSKHNRNRQKHSRSKLETLLALAEQQLQQGLLAEAESTIQAVVKLAPNSMQAKVLTGKNAMGAGEYIKALQQFDQAKQIDDSSPEPSFWSSSAYFYLGQYDKALTEIESAITKVASPPADYLFQKATVLMAQGNYADARPLMERLIQAPTNNVNYLNNAGNLYRDLGLLEKAEALFRRGMQVAPKNAFPYSNLLTTMHYDPSKTRDEIYQICLAWEKNYAPPLLHNEQKWDKTIDRPLRIGLISDGFRNHPVGRMIIAALERLPAHAYEFFAYSSTGSSDAITKRFKRICHYEVTSHLTDRQLAEKIRSNKIDILLDMAGHNSGMRMPVIAMKPAPVQIKWVGGLINTTGMSSVDYLISDWIETPEGDDPYYTEKLIRMPGDYVCYEMPEYTPKVSALPARTKGHITLGCFNNPMKVNPVVLEQWALIMRELPNSRLYLKGHQFSAEDLQERVFTSLEAHGVLRERVIIEGPCKHKELLECYNQVDIALDPWPYSGGLTTCEAFVMGVPVVTMPGPTFAGRHSATHLVNAGMPELVTHSWDEYRARVIELASDLDSLATIRSHLRTILLQSPVCDADSFAGDLNNALRAIWQRYCEGKPPEALSFNEQGEVLFADETEPTQLQHPEAPPENEAQQTFKWEFEGKVIAIDHGGQLMNVPVIKQMLDAGTLELIAFDPASNHLKHPLRQINGVHYYPNVALGNVQTATLYACQASEQSGTLKPAPHEYMSEKLQQDLNVLAELPIGTVALDKVSELPSVDWLVLDDLNDAALILENGETTLKDTLLIHVKLAFQPTHIRQPNFAEVAHWASRNGFRFYSFTNSIHKGSFYLDKAFQLSDVKELFTSDAIFIPNNERLAALDKNKTKKLSFILSTVYNAHDLSLSLVESKAPEISKKLLHTYGIIKKMETPYISCQSTHRQELVVGVPTYNEDNYIEQTIQSLQQQNIDNVLFYISDNASTDRTFEIIRDITHRDSRFVINQNKENIGALNNFERAFNFTASDYFMWLGGHDYISNHLLSNALEVLKNKADISMVCGQPMAVMNEKVLGHVSAANYSFNDDFAYNRYLKSVAELANCTIFHSVFRRSALEGYDFRHTLSHDHVLISRLLAFGKLYYLKNDFYFRRYFSERETTQEERMLGEIKKMNRTDFYDHYLTDFKKVFSNQPHVLAQAENIKKVLIKRFGD